VTHPTCPTHHRPLLCPACVGAQGKGRTSEAKKAAARVNVAKGREAKARKREEGKA